MKSDLTQEQLKEVLHYDPATGVWTWKSRPEIAAKVNARIAGKKAGGSDPRGYWRIGIDGKRYWGHRLAVLYMTGSFFPVNDTDHHDLDKSNNKWNNLRSSTRSQNMVNTAAHRDNTSGYKGVSWSEPMRAWRARIYLDGREKNLGYFDDPAEAHRAYEVELKRYHGEFARVS